MRAVVGGPRAEDHGKSTATPRVAAGPEGGDGRSDGPGPVPGRARAGRVLLSPGAAIAQAILLGLCAGYLDLAIILFKKLCWNPEGYYRVARDSPWSVPVSHAALMVLPGVMIATASGLRPGLISRRGGAWLLATLALWGALLRLPMYAACGLILAAGAGRVLGEAIADHGRGKRRTGYAALTTLAVLGALAAGSTGWRAVRESQAIALLPSAPPRARNVLLIVWDTVRAQSLALYGYARETTPHLSRWAGRGVTYDSAVAPAPWTFPSHSCFFTGRWPLRLDSQWRPALNPGEPTLAEYLASRGYQTAAFVANTNSCTYETGLDRGFARFEDYSSSPLSIIARSVPGQWLVTRALDLVGDYHGAKWAALQSRDATGINEAFLDWLGRRRADRPFFAFLNLFDAHESYIPPPGFAGRFGIRPTGRRDYHYLADFVGTNKEDDALRDLVMARDCYDDCVAYLDEQLGRLLDELGRRGLLADTDVILTSDHGEGFGEHTFLGHAYSVFREEIRVPLVILSPGAPAGKAVFQPVSLRDLPATVVDRLGLAEGSPFPGRSLAALWSTPPGTAAMDLTTPAFSEEVDRGPGLLLRPLLDDGSLYPRFRMSLMSVNFHYIRDGKGGELLFDVVRDPAEQRNLSSIPELAPVIAGFRARLLDVLTESPGSAEVERAYLGDFRRSLEAIVRGGSAGRVAAARPGGARRSTPSRGPSS